MDPIQIEFLTKRAIIKTLIINRKSHLRKQLKPNSFVLANQVLSTYVKKPCNYKRKLLDRDIHITVT